MLLSELVPTLSFPFQFLKIEVLLIYSVVSFSAVQWSDSVIHICIFIFFSTIAYHGILNIVPVLCIKSCCFSSVQLLSHVWLCNPMDCSMPGLPVHQQLLEFTQTHVHWVSDAIQPSHPLSSPSPPTFNHSQNQGLFKWVSSSHQVAKISEFQLQHQSFQWKPGLISFRMDWLDPLAVQGTLKSLIQHHSSKALSLLNLLVCIYQPQTPSPSLCLAPSPLATTSLFSMSMNLFLFCR